MDTIYTVQSWAIPLIDLSLMILCLAVMRGPGRIFVAMGFLFFMFASVTWPIADVVYNQVSNPETSPVYEIAGHVNFIAYLVAAGLFTTGIVKLGAFMRAGMQSASDAIPGQSPASTAGLAQSTSTNPYQTPAADVNSYQAGVDKGFGNILIYILPLLLGTMLLVIGIVLQSDYSTRDLGLILMLPAILVMLFAYIYLLVILYRLWRFTIEQSNQHGLVPAIETPGKAVGFLFIPFFNYYWVFLAYGKLAKDLNAIAKQKGISPAASEGLAIAIPILIVLGIIPFIGYLTSFVAGFILAPIYFSGLIRLASNLKNSA